MKLHPRLSRAAVELVSRFETFHPQAQPASGGGWTIGYGHTRTARQGAHVTPADADALLLYDLSGAAEAVEAALFAPANPHQFEALCAFCFNIGAENFRASSALARFNAGAELEAADEIERWRNAELGAGTQVVDALVRRRAAEKAHFLGLAAGLSTSPRAVLRPVADGEVARVEPPPPPPLPTPALEPGSATLAAAAGIQARLRELVPEPDAPSSPVPAEEAEIEPPPHSETASAWEDPATFEEPVEAGAHLEPEPLDAPAVDSAPPAVSEPNPAPVAPAPPPPPPPPPPSSLDEPPTAVPPPAEPAAPLIDPVASAETALPAVPASAQAVRRPFRIDARSLYALLSALGACLFVAAAVVIAGGRVDLSSLLMGVVGALVLALGVYGLLGPERRRDPAPPG